MIKRLPGWANVIALALVYMIVGFIVKLLMARYSVAWQFVIIISIIHAGIYLAKWRFDHGNWNFW